MVRATSLNVASMGASGSRVLVVAAIGVATHEAGHAIQHARHYAPLWVRSALVPTANIGSSIGYMVMLGGLFRAGDVRGGSFSGVLFREGRWHDGTWLGGFDRRGRYRPRGGRPPHAD